MILGLFTAAFPEKSLDEIASWSSENGFNALEIACWPISKADRRYSGVTHIDVTTLTADKAKKIYLCHRRDSFRAAETKVKQIVDDEMAEIVYSHQIAGLEGDKLSEYS